VWRADHRQLGRVLRGGPPGGGRDDLLDGCRLLPGRAGPPPYLEQGGGSRAIVAVFCLARLYLGLDHPGDALLAVAFAVAIAVTAFRFFTPNEVFPVAYRRGRTAHVD